MPQALTEHFPSERETDFVNRKLSVVGERSSTKPTASLSPLRETAERRNEDWVRRQLRDHGIIDGAHEFTIFPQPGNPARSDLRRKRSFVVWEDRLPVLHVTVGSDLRELWDANTFAARVAPELVCPPRFFFEGNGWQILGRSYFAGRNIEDLLAHGRMTDGEAADVVGHLAEKLQALERESSPQAARGELANFEHDILEMEAWSDFDRVFLQEVALPQMRESLLARNQFRSRWTNGDFIARNIVMGLDGEVRLVDYEFARCTHFAREDYHRFLAYSEVPALVKHRIEELAGSDRGGERLYFLLNQALLTERVVTLDLARDDIATLSAEIFRMLAPSRGRRRDLFRPETAPAESITTGRRLEVFWGVSSEFKQEESAMAVLEAGSSQRAVIMLPPETGANYIRVDPGDQTGVIRVEAVVIRSAIDGTVLAHWREPADFADVQVAGSAVRLPAPAGLLVFSTGTDPQLIFPVLPRSLRESVAVEVSILWDADLRWLNEQLTSIQETQRASLDLTRQREHMLVAFQTELEQVREASQTAQRELSAEVERLASNLREASLTSEMAAAQVLQEIGTLRDENATQERAIHDLQEERNWLAAQRDRYRSDLQTVTLQYAALEARSMRSRLRRFALKLPFPARLLISRLRLPHAGKMQRGPHPNGERARHSS